MFLKNKLYNEFLQRSSKNFQTLENYPRVGGCFDPPPYKVEIYKADQGKGRRRGHWFFRESLSCSCWSRKEAQANQHQHKHNNKVTRAI